MAADRFGPRVTIAVFTLVWSLAVGGVAWTGGFWNLIGARGAFGLAQAGAYPVLNKMTRVWFPLSIRTTVQGLVTAMGRIGAACAPVIVLWLLMGKLSFSWQDTLMILSIPGIVLAIVLWIAVRNSPREHPWMNEMEKEMLDPASSSPSRPPPSDAVREGEPPFRAPIADRPGWLLTPASLFSLAMMLLYIFASTFQDQFYVNWLPSFLKEKGFDKESMGLLAPWPLVGGAAGGILGGFLNDYLIRRTGNRRWARSGVAFTGKLIAACLVIVSIQAQSGTATMLVLIAVRVFSDWSLPTQWAAVTDMGGRAAATVFGIVNTVGAVGGFAAGPIFGYLREQYQWPGVFYGVAGMCVFAALTWLFIDCTKRLVGD
jgi:MFS family permease